MAKTALELTPEEWRTYHPADVIAQRKWDVDAQLDARWERAQRLAHTAATLLRDDFSATKVLLFGSLLHRSWFTLWSNIDLAVLGVHQERFFAAVAAVTVLSKEFKIDIVDPEMCRPSLLDVIIQESCQERNMSIALSDLDTICCVCNHELDMHIAELTEVGFATIDMSQLVWPFKKQKQLVQHIPP